MRFSFEVATGPDHSGRWAKPRTARAREACRRPGEILEIFGAAGGRSILATDDLHVRSLRAGSRRRRAAGGRQGREPRAAGLCAAGAAGGEPRAPGFEGRNHRKGLGRPRRLGRGRGEPRQIGAAGARGRRQVTAIHQDDPWSGIPVRRAGKSISQRSVGAAAERRDDEAQHGLADMVQRLDRIVPAVAGGAAVSIPGQR